MRNSARLLKDAYPVLLLVSLLMSWELTSHGSPENSARRESQNQEAAFNFPGQEPFCEEHNRSKAGECILPYECPPPKPRQTDLFPWETPHQKSVD